MPRRRHTVINSCQNSRVVKMDQKLSRKAYLEEAVDILELLEVTHLRCESRLQSAVHADQKKNVFVSAGDFTSEYQIALYLRQGSSREASLVSVTNLDAENGLEERREADTRGSF